MSALTTGRRASTRLGELTRGSRSGAALVLLQAVAAIAILAWVVKQEGLTLPLLSGSRYTITADFTNGDGLNTSRKPAVTVAGVVMGTVSNVRFENGQAVATLDLSSRARGKIFADASALITPRSAINDLTVDVNPGTPSAGALAGSKTIPQSRTESAVNLDNLSGVLNLDTRAQLQVLIDQLGIGVHGRSRSLDQAIQELHPFLDSTGLLASEMAQRQHLLSQLVSNLNIVFTTLGRRGAQLREILSAGQSTLGTVAKHQLDVTRTIQRLAPALANTSAAFNAVSRLATPLSPALAGLVPFAKRLPAALSALRAFVPTGRGLASDLSTLDREGPPGATALRALLDQVGPTSRALQPSVEKLLPVLQALDKHPAGIGDVGSHYSGIFSGQNANGPTLRAFGFFEPIRPENFGLASGQSRAGLGHLDRTVAGALDHLCLRGGLFACLARELTPNLPAPVSAKSGRVH